MALRVGAEWLSGIGNKMGLIGGNLAAVPQVALILIEKLFAGRNHHTIRGLHTAPGMRGILHLP